MVERSQLRAPMIVGLGAIAGACCRYYAGQWIGQLLDISFPIETLAVNLSGCFFMGLVITFAARQLFTHSDSVLLITTGFLGSFTTFSTYALDTLQLLDATKKVDAMMYWVGSPLIGVMCFGAGAGLAKAIADHRSS